MTLSRRAVPKQPADKGFASESRAVVCYFLVLELAAVLWVARILSQVSFRWSHNLGTLAFLIALAVLFEELARRAARLQLRLSNDLQRDMTSVWSVAGAVALPPASAVVFVLAVLTYIWFRQQRPAGQFLYRKIFNASTVVLAVLAAGSAARWVDAHSTGWPDALAGTVPVIVAIAVNAVVNRGFVTVALLAFGVRGKMLIGSAHDNLIELATLCLGGLVSLAIVYQPWLAILAVAPMYTLQRGALVRELETAASTDSKTGLYNAIAWEQVANRELSRAQRDGRTLAVLIVDIDRFKRVNDEFGHLAGDRVLSGVGRAISGEVRDYDTVGRFGGEEFVAVLPDIDEAGAMAVAERVRSRVNQLLVSQYVENLDLERDYLLSVSIGVSCTTFGGAEVSDLLQDADSALYRAKSNGRNRVVLGGAGPFDPAVETVLA